MNIDFLVRRWDSSVDDNYGSIGQKRIICWWRFEIVRGKKTFTEELFMKKNLILIKSFMHDDNCIKYLSINSFFLLLFCSFTCQLNQRTKSTYVIWRTRTTSSINSRVNSEQRKNNFLIDVNTDWSGDFLLFSRYQEKICCCWWNQSRSLIDDFHSMWKITKK